MSDDVVLMVEVSERTKRFRELAKAGLLVEFDIPHGDIKCCVVADAVTGEVFKGWYAPVDPKDEKRLRSKLSGFNRIVKEYFKRDGRELLTENWNYGGGDE